MKLNHKTSSKVLDGNSKKFCTGEINITSIEVPAFGVFNTNNALLHSNMRGKSETTGLHAGMQGL